MRDDEPESRPSSEDEPDAVVLEDLGQKADAGGAIEFLGDEEILDELDVNELPGDLLEPASTPDTRFAFDDLDTAPAAILEEEIGTESRPEQGGLGASSEPPLSAAADAVASAAPPPRGQNQPTPAGEAGWPLDVALSDVRRAAAPKTATLTRRVLRRVLDFLKWTAGAMVGLALAQLVLWWIFHLDPLGLGASLPRSMYVLIPAQLEDGPILAIERLRNYGPPPDSGSESDEGVEQEEAVDTGEPREAIQVEAGERQPAAEADSAATADARAVLTGAAAEGHAPEAGPDTVRGAIEEEPPPATPSGQPQDLAPANAGGVREGDAAGDVTPGTAETAPESGGEVPPGVASQSSPQQLGPPLQASFTKEDVEAAIVAARQADQRLDEAQLTQSQDLREVARAFFVAFADLAEKATLVDRTAADQVVPATRELLSDFEFDDKKQRMIGNAARGWLDNNLGQGVLLAGQVESIQAIGDLYEMEITLSGKSPSPVTVVSRLAPPPNTLAQFDKGDRLILLGVVVDDPGRNLLGYQGSRARVVWMSDLFVVIP